MDKTELKRVLQALPVQEYMAFMKDVHNTHPQKTTEMTNEIANNWKNKQRREAKKLEKPPQSTDLPAAETGDSGHGSKRWSSSPVTALSWQKSAWKTGFIFRGDKVPYNGSLFLDVEKVTMRKSSTNRKHHQKAATVAVVNEDGKLVLWAFIKIPHDDICQYAPKITNLDERKLGAGVEISIVHECLAFCLQTNTLVGAALTEDLVSLGYSASDIGKIKRFDIQSVFKNPNKQNESFALAHISKQLLLNRSGFQQGHHTAIDNARVTLAAYQHYVDAFQKGTFAADLKKLASSQQKYKLEKPKYYAEKCTC